MAISNGSTKGTGTSASTSPQPLPIVIAGGGCVGLFLALLLAHADIPNRILVIEPSTPDTTATRAIAHQQPTYPILSRVPGLLPALIEAGTLASGLCFRTSVANGSCVIAEKRFENAGEGMKGKGQLLLPQWRFQEVLLEKLRALRERAEVRVGSRVVGFEEAQGGGGVSVRIESAAGEAETVEAVYLVGADGAHSTIRKALDIPFNGETLDGMLVATDLYFDFQAHGFLDANFIIDPQDFGLIGRINKAGLWRVSYGVPSSYTDAQIQETVDEKLSRILPNAGLSPDGKKAYSVVRIAPYKAQQRCAESFWKGRVGLVGDAAHLANPYAGLGLASGIADASSLADVLIRIFSNQASDPEKMLSSWSIARRAKFANVVDKPSRMAYKRVSRDVSSPEKIAELVGSDPLVGAVKSGMPMMPPSLETRGEELEGW